MSAHTPGPPHTPWTLHSGGIPYIMCGERGPSFGPVTMAGTQAEMMAIATISHAAADLLAALKLLVADVADYEPWQRPCHALDLARVAIAKATP